MDKKTNTKAVINKAVEERGMLASLSRLNQ
jgi:hypothetical protein